MTSIQNRQPKGIPTGGQYAAKAHAEPSLSLNPRPAGLDGWPESLPVPTFDVAWDADGSMTTQVNAGGAVLNAYYTDPEGDAVGSSFEGRGHEGWTEDEQEQAKAWAEDFHGKYEARIREAAQKAAELARHRIAAELTGASAPISTASLWSIYNDASEASWMARRDAELAAASLLARRIHDRHPDAAYAELETDYDEEGEKYVSAFVSYSAKGEFLERLDRFGCVSEDEEDDGPDGYGEDTDDDVTALMDYINVDSVASRLHHPAPADRMGRGIFIDLRKASDWAPGAEGSL